LSKPIIFVVSPLRSEPGDPPGALGELATVNYTLATCRAIALAGGVPFAPHLLYPRFLDDTAPEERAIGIACGLRLMEAADEVWARLPPWRRQHSSGMLAEIDAGRRLQISRITLHLLTWPKVIVIADDAHFERELARLRKLAAEEPEDAPRRRGW
jgi:hypothetical protein